MRVLVVSSKYPPEYSGSGLRAHTTYKRLADRYGLEFGVITSSVTSNRSRRYVFEGVPVRLIANKPSAFMRKKNGVLAKRIVSGLRYRWHWQQNYWHEALPMLRYLFRNGTHFDVIHVFGNVTVTAAAITYAKVTGKPLIVELVNLVQDPHQYEPSLISALYGRGFPKQTLLVCLSDNLKQVCLNRGYTEDQIWCRLNPIDERRFHFEPDRKNRYRLPGLGQKPGDIAILQLAKFIPLKNQIFMIDVLSRLPDNYKLILMGPIVDVGPEAERDQNYYASIKSSIASQKLTHRVHIVPKFIDAPEHYMKAADVFVMPSTTEALGTPSLESIACGVPVVASDIPGVFERWIQPGVNGYICKLDPIEWATKIQAAANIPLKTMARAACQILKMASSSVIDEAYYRYLNEAVKRAKEVSR